MRISNISDIYKLVLSTSVATLVAALVFAPLIGATSPNTKVPGNNGTLKVHEQGTPANTESNDPKVCVFNFEGYGFDKGQSGVIAISVQGGGKDRQVVKTVSMPAANTSGYTETAYVTVANGHYKTTLYGKDVHGNADYNNDLKAKSKVIKVECAPSQGGGNIGEEGASTTAGNVLPASIPSTGFGALSSLIGTSVVAATAYTATLRRRK